VAGCVVHTDRGSHFRSRKFVRALGQSSMVGSMGRVGAAGDNAAMESFFQPAAEERPEPTVLGHPRGAPDRDRDLDRQGLSPPPQAGLTGPIDPHRVRDHHDRASHSGCVTEPVTRSCSRPSPYSAEQGALASQSERPRSLDASGAVPAGHVAGLVSSSAATTASWSSRQKNSPFTSTIGLSASMITTREGRRVEEPIENSWPCRDHPGSLD
jgi:hypothetical protein